MKILILGHNGLLGNMVYKYYKSKEYNIITTDLRWPEEDFKSFVLNQNVDFIINCIGLIPQRKPTDNYLYNVINTQLPIWLDNLNVKVIHPDTDEDDKTPYGLAKSLAREGISKNTKIIKTSILGLEKDNNNFSFLECFLHSKGKVNGYINQYWNGNTTYEWSKWSEKIMLNWDRYKIVTVLANPDCLSKYEILIHIKNLFQKDNEIIPVECDNPKNNCLEGDYITKDIILQIIEMKYFYEKN